MSSDLFCGLMIDPQVIAVGGYPPSQAITILGSSAVVPLAKVLSQLGFLIVSQDTTTT